MMAHWGLDGLIRMLNEVQNETLFITGGKDKAVPLDVAVDAAQKMANARVENLPDLGHLVHEEAPEQVVDLITKFLK